MGVLLAGFRDSLARTLRDHRTLAVHPLVESIREEPPYTDALGRIGGDHARMRPRAAAAGPLL